MLGVGTFIGTGNAKPAFTPAVNAVWTGITHYWSLDGVTTDSVGALTWTLENGAAHDTGIINNGLTFDGVNDRAYTSTNALNLNQSFSWSIWVYPIVTTQGYIWAYVPSSEIGHRFYHDGAFWVYKNNGSNVNLGVGFPGQWYHIVLSYDDATTTAKIYVNNVLKITDNTGNWKVTNTTHYLAVGVERYGTNSWYAYKNCKVDEFGIWEGVALTSTNVEYLYNSGSGRGYLG